MLDYPIFLTVAELRNEKVVFERACSSSYRLRRIFDRSFGIVVPSIGQVDGQPGDHYVRRNCAWGMVSADNEVVNEIISSTYH